MIKCVISNQLQPFRISIDFMYIKVKDYFCVSNVFGNL